MALTPTPVVDDDGSETTGTVWNAAFQLAFEAAINAALTATGAAAIPESQVTGLVADLALKAALASPALTGTPTAPTAAPGTNTTQLATTAFVTAAQALDAPLASPALTGTPTAPTATVGTNTTQVATTAFVLANAGSSAPVVQTTTLTGAQADFALTANCAVLRCNNATLLTLSGFAAGVDGQKMEIVSVGAGNVSIADQGAGSAAANRVIVGTGGAVMLQPLMILRLEYDLTSTRWRVIGPAATGQVPFPAVQVASADPNTLDDYEEGTWTPNDASGAGLTLTGVTGVYTKIGRCVFVVFTATYPSTANAAVASVGGLPFTNGTAQCALTTVYTNYGAGLVFFIQASSSAVLFYTTAAVAITNANMSTKIVQGSGVYFV